MTARKKQNRENIASLDQKRESFEPKHAGPYLLLSLLLLFAAPISVSGEETSVMLREDFSTLNAWKPLTFPKISKHSQYSIEKEGETTVLKAESKASASGIILKRSFNVKDYPKIKWKWKVNNTYANGDASSKSGDDFPLRVYIVFEYNPEKASFMERAKFASAKMIYGEYPPHSSLNYIWANKVHDEEVIINPYTDRSRAFALQVGEQKKKTWVEEGRNILDDYKKAFGEDPPERASLAIMNDSDNTLGSSVSFIDYIEVSK